MRHKPGFQTRYMVSDGFADVSKKLSTFAVSDFEVPFTHRPKCCQDRALFSVVTDHQNLRRDL